MYIFAIHHVITSMRPWHCIAMYHREWPPLESSSKSWRRKGEELAGILDERIYAVIFTTSSRQPHRHSPRCKAKCAWSVLTRSSSVKDSRWSRTRISIHPRIKRSSSFGMLFSANSQSPNAFVISLLGSIRYSASYSCKTSFCYAIN